jgi:hypothetical protein
MTSKRKSLIVVCVLGSVFVLGSVLALSINQTSFPPQAAQSKPVKLATPLPLLPVATFYLPTPMVVDTPPPLREPMMEPVESIEYLKSLPTMDLSQVKPPTSNQDVIAAPTLNATQESERAIQLTVLAATPVQLPTRFHVPPNGIYRRYIDPNVGFSFVYPGGWFVDAYTIPAYKFSTGYSMSIRSFQNTDEKASSYEKGEIKIEVVVLPDEGKPIAMSDLSTQAEQDAAQAGWKISDLTYITVSGVKGIRWMQQGDSIPQGLVTYMFRDEASRRVYQLYASPATSEYLKEFDRLVASFEMAKSN